MPVGAQTHRWRLPVFEAYADRCVELLLLVDLETLVRADPPVRDAHGGFGTDLLLTPQHFKKCRSIAELVFSFLCGDSFAYSAFDELMSTIGPTIEPLD